MKTNCPLCLKKLDIIYHTGKCDSCKYRAIYYDIIKDSFYEQFYIFDYFFDNDISNNQCYIKKQESYIITKFVQTIGNFAKLSKEQLDIKFNLLKILE